MIKSIPNSIILMIKNALPQVADQPHLPSLMINEKDFSTKNLSNKQYGVFSPTIYTLFNIIRTQPIVPLINLWSLKYAPTI